MTPMRRRADLRRRPRAGGRLRPRRAGRRRGRPPCARTSRRARDAHAEIAELGSVLPGARSRSVPIVEPPAGLKDRIMAAAAADLAAAAALPSTARPCATAVAPPPAGAGVAPRRATRCAGRARRRSRPPRSAPRAARPRTSPVDLGPADRRGPRHRRPRRLEPAAPGPARAPRRPTSGNVAAVLDAAAQPGSLTAVLAAGGGDGLRPRRRSGRTATWRWRCATSRPRPAAQVYEAWVIGARRRAGAARRLPASATTGPATSRAGGLPADRGDRRWP